MKDMPVSYSRLLNCLERQEVRLLRGGFSWPPIQSGLEGKIPPKVRQTLEAAFYKAFQTVFGPGGVKLVEKTIPVERLNLEQRLWEKELTPKEERAILRQMERGRRKGQIGEVFAAGTEGAALGLLGVGLPDIPVFLALLLRSLYQSACRYGFSYESDEERTYVLLLLQGALAQGEERRSLSLRADQLGRALDHGWPVSVNLGEETRAAASLLAQKLLAVKFVQGLPVVGVVGGAANFSVAGRVSQWGGLKYKKRFLERKVRGL